MDELINHEVWIEPDGERVLLKWGHYPEVDGKIDPLSITRAFAFVNGVCKPVTIGIDRNSSAKGGLFLEFEEAEALAVEYDRGFYTLTDDGKWIFGRYVPPNYGVKERRQILGFAKTYLNDEIVPLGLELEIMPEDVDDEVVVRLLFRGKPVGGVIKLRNSSGVTEFKAEKDGVTLNLTEGLNVISGKFVDCNAVGVDFRSLVTTLTILR